jgi:hypothetical protein
MIDESIWIVGGIVIDRVNKIFGDKLVPLPFLQHLMP